MPAREMVFRNIQLIKYQLKYFVLPNNLRGCTDISTIIKHFVVVADFSKFRGNIHPSNERSKVTGLP